jgi:phage shock protein A
MESEGTYEKFKEELINARNQVIDDIEKLNEEKAIVQRDIRLQTEKLAKNKEGLARRMQTQCEFDKSIEELENAHVILAEQAKIALLRKASKTSSKKKDVSD